ncbi:MAG: polysaccharide biosynthesis protein [Spirochaetia bacterium]|nr:polysaccharide biosynthesis protein [Spirochaetia bacterium]
MMSSYFLAHLIRYEDTHLFFIPEQFFVTMAIVVISRSVVFLFSGIYKSLWAYASLHDLVEIIKFTLISSLLSTVAVLFYNRFEAQSRMVPVLDGLILLGFLCIRSLSWRLLRENLKTGNFHGKNTLLIGADKLAVSLLTDLRQHKELGLRPIGFLDDEIAKHGGEIQRLPILGGFESLPDWISQKKIECVIIAKTGLSPKHISSIRAICSESKIDLRILPSVTDIFTESSIEKYSLLREIRVEDLLGRDTVSLDIDPIKEYLSGHVILVSGAGGSIGSEISRQVSQFKPSLLVLLDTAETPLYEIDYELRKKYPTLNLQSIVGDVKNLSRLSHIFQTFQPGVVFHCAAYKHVPLMELNPSEAVLNNILGTKNIADISKISGVEKFVLISTDKAVNPVNIMGASKRIAELYLQSISLNSKTRFLMVRFGNVLGSNGSVIPRFQSQIQKGGPITVTHPDVVRYFMTIPEASQLVLQAGSMGEEGEIFILDMGEPVKILELAEEMIRLSGLKPYQDIDIQFTGLRPGEKLYEELLLDLEGLKATHHPKIRIAAVTGIQNQLVFLNKLNQLFSLANANKNEEIYQLFKEIIPEYIVHKDYIEETKSSRVGIQDGR